jgi:hypothetical protein
MMQKTLLVFGWNELNNEYWVPHDQEPFAEAWNNPSNLQEIEFTRHAVTSISCPYFYHGQYSIPKYHEFISTANSLGYAVKVAIIGRDQTVLQHQQERLRGKFTYPKFEEHLPFLSKYDPVYLSTELLYLYKGNYIKSIAKQLAFPVHVPSDKLDEILIQDPNAKYFSSIEMQPLDLIVRAVSGLNNTLAE